MINVTIGESKTQEAKPFPKLMIGNDSGNIILFTKAGSGIVISIGVNNNNRFSVGEYFEAFIMNKFTDYNEPITLQNS